MFYIELKYIDGYTRLYVNQSKKTNAEHVKFFNRKFMTDSELVSFAHGEWNPDLLSSQIMVKNAKTVVDYHGN